MDIINISIDDYNSIIPLFIDYTNKIIELQKYEYETVSKLKNSLKSVNTNIKLLIKSKINDLTQVFNTADVIGKINYLFDYMYNIIQFDINEVYSEMSNSFLLNMEKDKQQLLYEYSILKRKISKNNITYVLFDIIKNYEIDTINNVFNKYNDALELYCHYMQYKIDLTPGRGEEYDKITNFINEAKYSLFLKSNNQHNENEVIQSFGLTPIHQSITLSGVLEKAVNLILSDNKKGGGYPDFEKDLKKLSDLFYEKKKGLLVIVSIGKSQIEFNHNKLMGDEIKKIRVNTGLNDHMLTTYSVINNIDKGFDAIGKVMKLGYKESNDWVILRTLNGKLYDIMGYSTDKIIVKKKLIEKLERGPSLLIENYHKLFNEDIIQFVNTPTDIELDKITPHSTTVKNLLIALEEFIDKKIEVPPTSLNQLYKLLEYGDIYELVYNIIIKSYRDLDISLSDNEIVTTFMYNSNSIAEAFIKSIKEQLVKSGISEFTFREKVPNALKSYIRNLMVDIFKKVSDKVFDPKKDIYEKTIIKNNLLNTSL